MGFFVVMTLVTFMIVGLFFGPVFTMMMSVPRYSVESFNLIPKDGKPTPTTQEQGASQTILISF